MTSAAEYNNLRRKVAMFLVLSGILGIFFGVICYLSVIFTNVKTLQCNEDEKVITAQMSSSTGNKFGEVCVPKNDNITRNNATAV